MLAVLFAGPVLTVAGVITGVASGELMWQSAEPWMYLLVALAVWSPLPFSVPAVLLDDARDAALPGYRGLGRLVRAVRLVPHMVWRSPARVEFTASLAGFALAVAVAWPYMT